MKTKPKPRVYKLIVECCGECPQRQIEFCTDAKKEVGSFEDIPDWCPLEKL